MAFKIKHFNAQPSSKQKALVKSFIWQITGRPIFPSMAIRTRLGCSYMIRSLKVAIGAGQPYDAILIFSSAFCSRFDEQEKPTGIFPEVVSDPKVSTRLADVLFQYGVTSTEVAVWVAAKLADPTLGKPASKKKLAIPAVVPPAPIVPVTLGGQLAEDIVVFRPKITF